VFSDRRDTGSFSYWFELASERNARHAATAVAGSREEKGEERKQTSGGKEKRTERGSGDEVRSIIDSPGLVS